MWSIRRRLTRHLLLAFGLLTGGALVLAASVVSLALRHALDSELRERVAAMSSLTEIQHGRIEYDFSPEFLREYDRQEHTERYFELWDEAGKSLVRSASLGRGHLLRPALPPGGKARIRDIYLESGRHARLLEKAYWPELETSADHPQPVWLALAVDRSALDRQIAAVWCASAGGALLAILVVAALVPPVLRRGLASLEALSAQTGRIDADSLATRFAVGELPGELQPIGLALNALLERLETSFVRERRFSADLAHELRTPIAELRNLVECVQKWPDSRDEAHDRDVLEIALQMEALVGRMLLLARLEAGEAPVPPQPVPVAEMIADLSAEFEPAAKTRGLVFDTAAAPAQVLTDPVMLRTILHNLWDNAVEHALAPGAIAVKGETIAGRYRITIANRTELAPADLGHLFDRFWRKDAARTDSVRHSGLGLSLAQSAAQRLGGTLMAALGADGQIVFTLLISDSPATPTPEPPAASGP